MRHMGPSGRGGPHWQRSGGLAWRTALALLALASIAHPTRSSAQAARTDDETSGQLRPWQLGVWVQSGIMRAFGRLATNRLPDGVAARLDVRAELESALAHSGGLELWFPTQGFSVRTGWETTTGGTAEGFLALCDLADCIPESVSATTATMSGLVIEVRVFQTSPEQTVTPIFTVGYGRRWYSFGDVDCADLTEDPRIICDAIAEVFKSPGSHSVLRASAGIGTYLGRVRADLAASAAGGNYSGGEGQTLGRWYPDVRVTLGVGLVVF